MIDDIDRKLIHELQREKRLDYSTLAKKLQISRSTLSRRVNRMLRENIIRMIAVPNIKAMGDKGMAMIGINVEVNKLEQVCSKLETYDSVHMVSEVLGRYDVFASVNLPDIDMLADFIKKELSGIEGIIRIETFYISDLRKMTFGWLSRSAQPHHAPGKTGK